MWREYGVMIHEDTFLAELANPVVNSDALSVARDTWQANTASSTQDDANLTLNACHSGSQLRRKQFKWYAKR